MTTLNEAAAIQRGTVEFRGSICFTRRAGNRIKVQLITHDGIQIWCREMTQLENQTLTLSPLAMALNSQERK